MSIRRAASCCQPRQVSSVPRGARTGRAPGSAFIRVPGAFPSASRRSGLARRRRRDHHVLGLEQYVIGPKAGSTAGDERLAPAQRGLGAPGHAAGRSACPLVEGIAPLAKASAPNAPGRSRTTSAYTRLPLPVSTATAVSMDVAIFDRAGSVNAAAASSESSRTGMPSMASGRKASSVGSSVTGWCRRAASGSAADRRSQDAGGSRCRSPRWRSVCRGRSAATRGERQCRDEACNNQPEPVPAPPLGARDSQLPPHDREARVVDGELEAASLPERRVGRAGLVGPRIRLGIRLDGRESAPGEVLDDREDERLGQAPPRAAGVVAMHVITAGSGALGSFGYRSRSVWARGYAESGPNWQ